MLRPPLYLSPGKKRLEKIAETKPSYCKHFKAW